MKKILKNERGSEVIEFVILFPILIFLIFGAITFFLATYSKIIVADAAREGARAGALAASGEVESVAREKVRDVIDGAAVNAFEITQIDVTVEDDDPYELVNVKVTGSHSSLVPAVVKPMTISSTGVFKREKR